MTTEAQLNANRQNAQLSTGPTTAAGKRKSSQNAFRHGLRSTVDVAPDEDQSEFNRHRKSLLDELAPVGAMESFYAERIVTLTWHLARATRLQSGSFDSLALREDPVIIRMPDDFSYRNIQEFKNLGMTHREFREIRRTKGVRGLKRHTAKVVEMLRCYAQNEADEETELKYDNSLSAVAARDFGDERVLDRLAVYERRIEQSLDKARQSLDDLQTRRLAKYNSSVAASAAHPQASSLQPQASHYNSSPCQGEVAARAAGGVPVHLQPSSISVSSVAEEISPNEPNPDPSKTPNQRTANDLPQSAHSCAPRAFSCAPRKTPRIARNHVDKSAGGSPALTLVGDRRM